MYELLRTGKFVLLGDDHAAEAAKAWPDRVVTATVDGQAPASAALVRPDGYFAWATDETRPELRGTAIKGALSQWCGGDQQAG